jgi:hypothetical protein
MPEGLVPRAAKKRGDLAARVQQSPEGPAWIDCLIADHGSCETYHGFLETHRAARLDWAAGS